MNSNTLTNPGNYGALAGIAESPGFVLRVDDITAQNWKEYYDSILNILKDGIYSDYVQQYFVTVVFHDGQSAELSIMDLYINIIMWRLLIIVGTPVMPKHIFFEEETTAKDIKKYIDRYFISANRTHTNNKVLSNIIADTLHFFHDIDMFSAYLSNTLNLEDSILLMDKDPDYYECLHADLSNIPIDRVKEVGMEYTNRSINCITRNSKKLLGYDHCLADAWRAKEGISPKQYMEFTIGIGSKPDGRGGIFNKIINTSFINGGVVDPVDYLIESSVSRVSQIIKFKSVSTSGAFARIIGLNNMDSFLFGNESYDCGTKHLIPITVKTDGHLQHLNLRYFREYPSGIERCLDYEKDKHLIGKTIFLRDPCTCASAARGHGVCYKCYGQLAYSVFDSQYRMGVNIGRIAGELITSKLTQKQLSVKHILEANITKIGWSPAFDTFFEMEVDIVQINSQLNNLKDYRILINPDDIDIENEAEGTGIDDGDEIFVMWLNEFITEFDVLQVSTGEIFHITTSQEEKLYFTNEFNGMIRKKAEPVDGRISIGFSEIKDNPIFIIQAQNNEITRTLDRLKNLYNKVADVKGKDIHQLLQEILDTNIEAGMGISAIHYSILLMNQIRSADDILERPDWSSVNPSYQILTLNEALTNNPAVLISLSYQKISRIFYNPLTYRKHKPSFIDLFFMERPQRVIRGIDDEPVVKKRDPGERYNPIIKIEDPNRITADSSGDEEENAYEDYDDE